MVWLQQDNVVSLLPSKSDESQKTRKGFVVRLLSNLSLDRRRKPKHGSSVNEAFWKARKPSVDEVQCTTTLFSKVSNQIWNFVLPESGEHNLHVVAVGTSKQRVFLDDVELQTKFNPLLNQTTFEGPGGAALKLKQAADHKTSSTSTLGVPRWNLLVNGCMVEEAACSGNGLRDLRRLPDGEYTIANGFDAGSVVQNACRKFKFLLDAEQHEVTVAHQECVWQVSLDGKLVEQERHALEENSGRAEFKVEAAGGVKVPARLEMKWILKEMRWAYHLQVGGESVPAYWNKVKGFVSGVAVPDIGSATAGPLPENLFQKIESEVPLETNCKDKRSLESLPQGVSYDRETKTYQANIKDPKTKRYVLLGEFASAELAHSKYLEALDRFAPDKRLSVTLLS
eukprot:gnl/MRDRNA2_/MRDRNA2_97039_c0_seq1.p1 gnl/MRDRNA2_/MRDRNA2_97039_c0~~gnl/MRDRNA2_/MRDRNA2_97039_c0_seq1.p1  ORF type:complete len:397 (+),score=90.17 gnl/MRDRNA2_/MRDRNA2_97039_c0_seq1:93-1283(+)